MIGEKLRAARAFEIENRRALDEELQPRYHVTGGVGWINDPNGFSLYRGEYHLFFQYHPYDCCWGPMHWGHVKSRDLIHWERLPAALAPEEEYDRDGCFSGSAIELPDGRHLLIYTGVRQDPKPDGTVEERQVQCAALGNGVEYEKYAGNPVIGGELLPPGGSRHDFRDPKIWSENGRYYVVAGNRCQDGSGEILLFESDDAFSWRCDGVVAASRNRHGRMWECPDFFALDGRQVLLVSPQEMKAQGMEFIPGNGTLCLIGEWKGPGEPLRREREQTIDYGLDFYAPQTTVTADGRRVMIGWMQHWDSVGCRPAGLPFFGQLTVPRELHVWEGRLIQNPVRELEDCRSAAVTYRDLRLEGEAEPGNLRGRCLDMTVTVRPAGETGYQSFCLELARDDEFVTTLCYEPGNNQIRVDRSRSGFSAQIVNTRDFLVRDRGGVVTLRVLLDRWSLELFVNGGEQAASFTLYTRQEADGVRFRSDGPVLLDVEKYDLVF